MTILLLCGTPFFAIWFADRQALRSPWIKGWITFFASAMILQGLLRSRRRIWRIWSEPGFYEKHLKQMLLIDAATFAVNVGAASQLLGVPTQLGGLIGRLVHVREAVAHAAGVVLSWIASGILGNFFYDLLKRLVLRTSKRPAI